MMKSKPTLIVFIKTLKKTSVLVLWSFEVTSLSSNKWPHLQPTHVCACNIASLSLVCFTEVHLSNDYCTNVSPAIRLSSTAFVLRRDCTWVLLRYLVSTYKGVYVTACDVFPFAHLATLLLHTPTTAPPHTHWHSHTYTVVDLERYTVGTYCDRLRHKAHSNPYPVWLRHYGAIVYHRPASGIRSSQPDTHSLSWLLHRCGCRLAALRNLAVCLVLSFPERHFGRKGNRERLLSVSSIASWFSSIDRRVK